MRKHQYVDKIPRGRISQNDKGQRWMKKVRPWCGQPSDRGQLKQNRSGSCHLLFLIAKSYVMRLSSGINSYYWPVMGITILKVVHHPSSLLIKQGVVLTGRNTTGPPCSRGAIIRLEAAWRHRLVVACRPAMQCKRRRGQTTTTNDDRRPRPLLVWPLHYVQAGQ